MIRIVISYASVTRYHLIVLLVVLAFSGGSCSRERTFEEKISDHIREHLERGVQAAGFVLQGEPIRSIEGMRSFYAKAIFSRVWSAEDSLKPTVAELISFIKQIGRDGLRPEEYHLAVLKRLVRNVEVQHATADPDLATSLADLDIVLTDAFLMLASHLSEGKLNPETAEPDSARLGLGVKGVPILERALRTGRIARELQSLAPNDTVYQNLREALRSYEAIAAAGGWGRIADSASLKIGTDGAGVTALFRRLVKGGDMKSSGSKLKPVFDGSFEEGIRRFQRRHGLEVTGILDSVTLVALNVPVERRIEQIRANMERWRWLPRAGTRRLIRVNVADMSCALFDEGHEVLSMKVVVGIREWPTPLFTSAIDRIIINPSWISPKTIFAAELINYIRADSNYLSSNKMKILRTVGNREVELDPRAIHWKELNLAEIDFRLWQAPGPLNIMGRVKFLLPNDYDVFLHDTPYKEDFPKRLRLASHGCIRLEKPFDLAAYLLKDMPDWTLQRIMAAVDSMQERHVELPTPFPVHVVYLSAWRDRAGVSCFREDVYGLDERVNAALRFGKPANPVSRTSERKSVALE